MALGVALASENMIMRGEEEEEEEEEEEVVVDDGGGGGGGGRRSCEEQGRHVSAECLFFLKPFFRSG